MTLNVSDTQPDFPFQKAKYNEQKLRNDDMSKLDF